MKAGICVLILCSALAPAVAEPISGFPFQHHYGDRNMRGDALAQTALADLDHDGDLDFIVGRRNGPVNWYEYQSADRWIVHRLGEDSPSDVGGVAMDVNGDGWTDHVTGGAWYENPENPRDRPFLRHVFDPELSAVHDIIVADMDGDGKPDVITMSDQNDLRWYKIPSDPEGAWKKTRIGKAVHSGISSGDLDGDGEVDIVRSDTWLENQDSGRSWVEHRISKPWGNRTKSWTFNATQTRVADLNRDGRLDIVVADGEIRGARIAWIEGPADPVNDQWTIHYLPHKDTHARGAFHSLAIADFDQDGDPDIFTGEMEAVPGEKPPRWYIWENKDGRGKFVEHVVLDAGLGAHAAVAGDVDGDGDIDICSKPWRAASGNANGGRAHFSYLENRGAGKPDVGGINRETKARARNAQDLKPTAAKTVVLTFDDSVKSHFTVGRPLLKELGFSATFFITEGFDFKTNKADYMTWEEIRQLHDDGFEIGNHTRDHLGVTAETLKQLPEQIASVNEQCRTHGIPVPVSFAYPGNAFHLDALPILAEAGIKFARRGGSPEYAYDEGGGVAYEPGRDHPLLIPSVGDARPGWTLKDFKHALNQAASGGGSGGIPVLQFHGVPDRQHPWVHTPPEQFKQYMAYLKDNGYRVLAMRDLERVVESAGIPDDPEAVIKDRVRRIEAEKLDAGRGKKEEASRGSSGPPVKTMAMSSDTLSAVLQDNSESPDILSGLQSLFHRNAAPPFDAFDPDTKGASAGLNFEHIISGRKNPANRFTPRHGKYPLFILEKDKSGVLVRKAANSPWATDSSFEYALRASNSIDFEFRCTTRDASRFGDRKHAVFFFANYMNDVDDVALHFRGVERPGGEEAWIRAEAPRGHPDYNGGGTYRGVGADALEYDEDHDFKLNLWSYDHPRISEPFYYGRAAKGMVFILMFDRLHSDVDEIRFSLFKFKIPRHPRPAWDFQYVIHRVEQDRQYGFKGRLVWKRFISADDCRNEYLRWKQ